MKKDRNFYRRRLHLAMILGAVMILGLPLQASFADMAAAEKWVDNEFQPSTLSREDQLKEMAWFIEAARPFQGMSIRVLSETITTHEYESSVLAKAFTEITGINVTHELIQEGDVIEKLQTQRQSNENLYDAYVSDADLLGTHFRYQNVVPLSDWMTGEGKEVTLPTLEVDDFIGKSFTTAPDGKLYQLPDQQFVSLYWFRYDWFQRDDLKEGFKDKYGYALGVPRNWSAYEDIADFFTNEVKEIDGVQVYGHMDYGKQDPSQGWHFTDAWLAMAGTGDKGLPNPVDAWGIRVEDCRPVGSSISRGGATNAPASVYALAHYIDWLKQYAPPEAANMAFSEAGSMPAQGNIAQQIVWYTTFTPALTNPESAKAVLNEDGTPKWRLAPSPQGSYWEEGMKLGYHDIGSWTLMKSTPLERRRAAWLYAQFTVSKTVSLKKTLVGLTPIRESDLQHEAMTEAAPRLGGLVEFYRSPARDAWTPASTNVPDYPKLAQLWWLNVAEAMAGSKTPQEALDNLAKQQDRVLQRLEKAGVQEQCGPALNEERDPKDWLDQPGAPKLKLQNEKPQGKTMPYDRALQTWQKDRAM